jgi:hypothetical protein
MAKKNKPATTNAANLPALRIGSRVRCTEDGVEGRIVRANGLMVTITWSDGEKVTWRRDSLATKPIEIIDDETAPAAETNAEPATTEPEAEQPAVPTTAEPATAQTHPRPSHSRKRHPQPRRRLRPRHQRQKRCSRSRRRSLGMSWMRRRTRTPICRYSAR